MMNFIIGVMGITLTIIMVIMLNKTSPQNQPNIDRDVLGCGDTITSQVIKTKEDKVWTGTTQGVDTTFWE